MKQNRTRTTAILAALLAMAIVLGACRNEDILTPPDTTVVPPETLVPTTTAGSDPTTAPETTAAPQTPPELAPVGTVQADVAPGYTMRTIDLPGSWTAAEWFDLDDDYALICTTGTAQGLHLLECASGKIVDSLTLPADKALPELRYNVGSSPDKDTLSLYALEQEGDAYAVVRTAWLRWQDGRLELNEQTPSGTDYPARWTLSDPVGRTEIVSNPGFIRFLRVAQLRDGIWSTPHINEIRIPSTVPARYAPLAYLDESRAIVRAVGTGSPPEHDYFVIHLREGKVDAIPALDGMQIVGVHGDTIHAIDPNETPSVLYAYNTLGQRVVRHAATADQRIHDRDDGVLIETVDDVEKTCAFALYSPDMTAQLARFTLAAGLRERTECFVSGKEIYLVGRGLPDVEQKLTAFVPETPAVLPDVEPIDAEIAGGAVLARTVPGVWADCAVLRYNDQVLMFVTQGEGEHGWRLRFYHLFGSGQFSVPYDLPASEHSYRYLERLSGDGVVLYAKPDGAETATAAVKIVYNESVTPYDAAQIVTRPDETAADHVALYTDGCVLDLSADAKTVTVRSADGTARRAVVTLPATADLRCAILGQERLILFGGAMSDVETTRTDFAAQTPIAVSVNAESSFTLRTVEVPGLWASLVTHPLDSRYTLIEAIFRRAVGDFSIGLHLLDNETGRITASTTFDAPDELAYLAEIGDSIYLYNLRSARGETARVEHAVKLSWSPTELRVEAADAAAVPTVFSTLTAENGVYTVGATTDHGISRFTADGQEKRLLTPNAEVDYYEPIGFLDNTRLLYLYRNRIGVLRDRYATVDVATGEVVALPQLDGTAVSEVVGGMIYAEEERMDEGDFAYWAISESGWKTLLYTVPAAEKFTRSVWTEGRFRIEAELDPKAASNTYTVYSREFSRVEAKYTMPADCHATRMAMQEQNTLYFLGRELPPVVSESATFAPVDRPEQPPVRVDPITPDAPPTVSVTAIEGFGVHTVSLPDAAAGVKWRSYRLDERFTLFQTYTEAGEDGLLHQNLHLFDAETGRITASRLMTASRLLDCIQVGDGKAVLYSSVKGSGEVPFPMVARQIAYGVGTLNVLPMSAFLVAPDYLTMVSPDGRYTVHSTFNYTLTATTPDGQTNHLLTCPYYTAWNTAYFIPIAFVDNTRLLYRTLHDEIALIDVSNCAKLPFPDLEGKTFAGYHDGVIYATSVSDGEIVLWAKPLAENVRELGRSQAGTLRFADGYWLSGSNGSFSISAADLADLPLATVILQNLPVDRYTVIGSANALYFVGVDLPATPEAPVMVAHSHSASGTVRDGIRYDERGYAFSWSMPYGWFFEEKGGMYGSAYNDCWLDEGELTLGLDADAWLGKVAERGLVAAFAGKTDAGIPYRVARYPDEHAGYVYFDLGEGYAYTLSFNVYTTEAAFADTLTAVLDSFTFELGPVPTPLWRTIFPGETGEYLFAVADGAQTYYAFRGASDTAFTVRVQNSETGWVGELPADLGWFAGCDFAIPVAVHEDKLFVELRQNGRRFLYACRDGIVTEESMAGLLADGLALHLTDEGMPPYPTADEQISYLLPAHGSSLDWTPYDDRPYTVTLTASARLAGSFSSAYRDGGVWGPSTSAVGKLYHGFDFGTLTPDPALGGTTASGIPYAVLRGNSNCLVYFTLPEGYTYHISLEAQFCDYETQVRPVIESVDIVLGEPTFPFHAADFPADAPYYRFARRTETATYYFFDGYADPRRLKLGYTRAGSVGEISFAIPPAYAYDEAIFVDAAAQSGYSSQILDRLEFIIALRQGEDWRLLRYSDRGTLVPTEPMKPVFLEELNDRYLFANYSALRTLIAAHDLWTGQVQLPALSPAEFSTERVEAMLEEALPGTRVSFSHRVPASATDVYRVTLDADPAVTLTYANTPGSPKFERVELSLPESGLMPPFALDDGHLLYASEWPSVSSAGQRPIQQFYLVEAATGQVVAITEISTDVALDRISQVADATYLWAANAAGDDPQGARAVWRVTVHDGGLVLEKAEGVTLSVALDPPAGAVVTAGYRMRGTRTTLWLCRANTGVCLLSETDGEASPVPLALPEGVSYNESSFHLLYDDAGPGVVTLLLTLRDGAFEGYTYRYFVYTNAATPGSSEFALAREIGMEERVELLAGGGVIVG